MRATWAPTVQLVCIPRQPRLYVGHLGGCICICGRIGCFLKHYVILSASMSLRLNLVTTEPLLHKYTLQFHASILTLKGEKQEKCNTQTQSVFINFMLNYGNKKISSIILEDHKHYTTSHIHCMCQGHREDNHVHVPRNIP